ncbi:hypothetical protein ACQ4LE_005170 [Meloidogyne hapla]|uniref:GST_C_6 domain-containing protein n=1 Tax=Meloidogyne hapla TaxID=6305 RepID=A0A1I8B6A7_MELHA
MSLLNHIIDTLPAMNEEWSDAVLFAPLQDEQAMMDQFADTLAVRVFLKMANLPYKLEQRQNADFMSPTGEVPFLRVKNSLIAEFSPIVDFVGKKGIKLSDSLTASDQSDIQAYCALIEETLRNAEKYISWLDEECYDNVTSGRYSSVYNFPLNLFLPLLKQREVYKYLCQNGWADNSIKSVVELCDRCFHALSMKLGSQQKYFVGGQPTELDALAFGHLYTILTMQMPNNGLINALKKYPNLINFCKEIEREYFT